MPRLVIVEPAYRSTVGHHGEVNRPLLLALAEGGWQPELWADVALEAEASAPGPLRGVFSGCGYEDPRQWSEPGGMVLLARRLEQQLQQAAAGGSPVAVWLAHSLLPFQLLGLARHLAQVEPARVLISLMFAPGETLQGPPADPAAEANARMALAALARVCAQRGHHLTLAFPSRQQQQLYAPLLAATGLRDAGLHPAVVGAGCRPARPGPDDPPLVLLHWGDLKAGKGRQEALAVLEALLERGVPPSLAGWRWLFHIHSLAALEAAEERLMQRAEQELGLVWLRGELESERMQAWLARCPLALLAYAPQIYAQRSSGLFWQWAAGRAALGLPMAAVGHAGGWLAAEAQALGIAWRSPAGDALPSPDGTPWLAALAAAAAQLPQTAGLQSEDGPSEEGLTEDGQRLLTDSFGRWCLEQLAAAIPVAPPA